jgi:hypothetical protein
MFWEKRLAYESVGQSELLSHNAVLASLPARRNMLPCIHFRTRNNRSRDRFYRNERSIFPTLRKSHLTITQLIHIRYRMKVDSSYYSHSISYLL